MSKILLGRENFGQERIIGRENLVRRENRGYRERRLFICHQENLMNMRETI